MHKRGQTVSEYPRVQHNSVKFPGVDLCEHVIQLMFSDVFGKKILEVAYPSGRQLLGVLKKEKPEEMSFFLGEGDISDRQIEQGIVGGHHIIKQTLYYVSRLRISCQPCLEGRIG